ncbi:4Fe-4S dicluster domain-containing protein [Vulgatibacter sp.]|uniref:4Fe-4S dicluster domain-containing protein n=1 Tax=Vulgatibacter sp. TaxID=1971226 RepID=UPI003562A804
MARETGPNLDRLSSIKEDGSRNFIQPADVKGRFVTWRRIVYATLIAIYVLLPFVKIGGHPAVFLDIEARRFFLFGATFNAQDAWLLFFLLASVGFGLLFFTAWLGRVWCGWACPQTVFLEGVYRRVERWIEGPREKRIRANAGPMTAGLFAKKALKHAAFVAISLLLAHVFVSFFVSLEALFAMVQRDPREHWVAFLWVFTVAALLYFNFAWFREQLCIVICPYGRLQSVMQDGHSLVIGYDVRRGEPRARITRADREKKIALPQVTGEALAAPAATTGLAALAAEAAAFTLPAAAPAAGAPPKGDCIDCRRCVVVCPTGIDIRNGLQLECIGCAQCIDACDEVMDKVGRPRGLIRYDSHAGLAGEPKRVVRGRLFAYGGALAVAILALAFGSTVGRKPFEANLLRVRGAPYVLEAGNIRNQYELHLVNKNAAETEFRIKVEVPAGAHVVLPRETVKLGSLQSFRLPIFVTMEEAAFTAPFEVEVEVTDGASTRHKEVEARFLGPLTRRNGT